MTYTSTTTPPQVGFPPTVGPGETSAVTPTSATIAETIDPEFADHLRA